VLVILGLLAGGILAGKSLIRASELRSVITEYSRYATATSAFRDRFFSLPGDMTNATRIWGDNATYCADPAVADGTPGTCNGNGDGAVVSIDSTGQSTQEIHQYWNQLSLAGLIEGTYTGISGPTHSVQRILGTNAPVSHVPSAGWMFASRVIDPIAAAVLFTVPPVNAFTIGAVGTPVTSTIMDYTAIGMAFTPAEVWNIDTKLDDGKPGRGKVLAAWWPYCTNAASTTDYDAVYSLSTTGKSCAIIIIY
jgi:hypothetical protein